MINNNTNDVRKCEIIGGSFRVTLVKTLKCIFWSPQNSKYFLMFLQGDFGFKTLSWIRIVFSFWF